MFKKEYLKRKYRRVTAMALALLMSVSVFAQTLPGARAEDVSGSDAAIADTTLPDIVLPIPVTVISAADASVNDIPAIDVSVSDVSVSDVSASDVSASDVSASDVLSPEFSAVRKINGWMISVYAPEGVIPGNAELRVTNVNGALRDKAEAVADVEFDILVDVTFFADGREIQPDVENGLVQISLTKEGAVSGAFEMYHFNEAVTDVEVLDTEIDGDTATAEVEHFSLIGGDDSIKTWTAFAAAVANAKAGDEIKLDGDIVRDADATAITISKNLTIDLNGYTISNTSAYKDNGNLFSMSGSGEPKLTISNGTIDGFKNNGNGGAFYLSGEFLYLNLNGVTVQNCSSKRSGGAVYESGSTKSPVFLYAHDSVFKNCTATGRDMTAIDPLGGGAIYLYHATLETYNTKITGCSATDAAGGIGAYNDSVWMSHDGSDIYGNSADWGGGVMLSDSRWVIYGDTKIHCNSDNYGAPDLYVMEPNTADGSVYFTTYAEQVSPIYISTDSPIPFCKQSGYEDYQSLFVSMVPNKVVRPTNYRKIYYGLGLVAGRRVVVDPAMKNGTVTVQPWYDSDYDTYVSDFTSTTGGTVSFSVAPAAGYELDKLYYVEGGDTTEHKIENYDETNKKYSFAMPDTDVTIYATFKGLEYNLTVDSPISNGTVTAANTKYKTGDTVSLTVTPASGYKLDTLYYKVEGDTTEHPIDGTSFTMPAGNTTVYATFKQDHVHNLQYFGGAFSKKISAICLDGNCPLEWDPQDLPTLTIDAQDAEYTALPYAGLSIDDKLTSVINDTYSVHYTGESGTTYDSNDAPTDIGSYKVKVALVNANKNTATCFDTFKITKPSQTVTFTPNVTEIEMTVGDTDKKLTYALTKGDGELSCSIAPGTGLEMQADGTLVATVGGSAGSPAEYTITVKAAETDTYKETTATVKVKVTKKTQTISGDTEIKDFAIGSDPIALSSKNVKTNATGNTLTYTVTEGSDYITVDNSGTVTAVKPGTAKIKVSAAAYGDYDAAEDLIITVTVVKGTQTISGSETMTVYYGGDLTDPTKPIKLDAVLDKSDAEGKLSYVSGSLTVCEVAEDGTLTIKKPGTAKITVSAPATTLYNTPADKEITVTVNPRPLTITLNNKSAKVGEAMPAFDYVTPTLVGSDTLPGTIVKFTCSAPVTDSKLTTAGSYDITAEINNAKFLALYDVTFTKATLTVTKHEHVWQYELNDACDTALAYCTRDDDKCDYYGKDNALKFTLKVPAVHSGASSLVYDGEAFPVIYDGDENAEFINECGLGAIDPAIDITYYCGADVSHAAPVNAGTYIAMLNIPKANGEGYLNIGAPTKNQYVEFTIAKAEQTVNKGDDVTMTIGESGKKVTASVTKGDGALSYTVSPSAGLTVAADGSLTAAAAGTYTVTAKAAATTNYNEKTETIKVTVSKKTQTITAPASITVTYGTPVSIEASTDGDGALSYESNNTALCTVDSTGKVTFAAADSSAGNFVTVKAAATDTCAAAEVKVAVKTVKASAALEFDPADTVTAYSGETAAQVNARVNAKLTGLVTGDVTADYGTPDVYVLLESSHSILDNSEELLAAKKYLSSVEIYGTGTKKDCYTVNPFVIQRDLPVVLREQEIKAENITVKLGETGKFVSGTVSEKAIEDVAALTGKFGDLTYEVTDGSSYIDVDATTGAVTVKGVGTATVKITAAGNAYYKASEAKTITVTVSNKDIQTVSASAPAKIYVGDNTQKVTASTDGDGALSYTAAPADVVSVAPDGTITALKAGEATITVTAAETDNYAPDDENITVTVSKRTQQVKADALTLNPTDVDPTAGAVVSEKKIDGVAPLPALVGKPGAPVYSSSDESVIKVDPATGAVTIVGPGEAKILVTVPGNDYFDEISDAAPVAIKVTVEELKILDGQDGKYIIGSKEGLAFHCNGSYKSFTTEDGYVEVDDVKVDAANYDVSEGSTIVKFKPAYLDKLKVGKHKLTFVYKNGSVSCNFTVEQKSGGTPDGEGPKTGDTTNVILLVNLLLLSAVVVVYFLRKYDFAALLGRKANSTEE